MPNEIPGYYFDAAKGKYFKIQPNHIAPKDSPYSRQAVNATRKTQNVNKSAARVALHRRKALVERDYVLNQHLNFDSILSRRLGLLKLSATEIVTNHYLRSLRGRAVGLDEYTTSHGSVLRNDPIDAESTFTVSPYTGELYAASWTTAEHTDPEDKWSFIVSYSLNDSEDGSDSPTLQHPPKAIYRYAFAPYEHITRIVSLSADILAFSSTGGSLDQVVFLSRDTSDSQNRAILRWDSIASMARVGRFHDIAFTSDRKQTKFSDSTVMAVAGEKGVLSYCVDGSSPVGKMEIEADEEDGFTAVSFKDQNVFMSGTKSGKIILGDLRGGSALRFGHDSAVSAVECLRDDNRIVVCGLTSASVYDLRFTPQPRLSRQRTEPHNIDYNDISNSQTFTTTSKSKDSKSNKHGYSSTSSYLKASTNQKSTANQTRAHKVYQDENNDNDFFSEYAQSSTTSNRTINTQRKSLGSSNTTQNTHQRTAALRPEITSRLFPKKTRSNATSSSIPNNHQQRTLPSSQSNSQTSTSAHSHSQPENQPQPQSQPQPRYPWNPIPRDDDYRYVRAPPSSPPLSTTPSTPLFTLPLAPNRLPSRYGMGFLYDPLLEVIYIASTDHHRENFVSVYSASNGKKIDSGLGRYRFGERVDCICLGSTRAFGLGGGLGGVDEGGFDRRDGDGHGDRLGDGGGIGSVWLKYGSVVEQWSPF